MRFFTRTEENKAKVVQPGDTINLDKPKEEDNWIWVEGYKGVTKDLRAYNGFQYELHKEYSLKDNEKAILCESGFHFCLKLSDVLNYYGLKNNNRFFKVMALVQESEYNKYGQYDYWSRRDKLAAKSIVLTEEVPLEEVLECFYKKLCGDIERLPEEYNEIIYQHGYEEAKQIYNNKLLINAGYSECFAAIICEQDQNVKKALAIASQEGVSMDMKVWYIFH